MLLQPFAENAIQHGFKGSSGDRKLSISIQKKPNALFCIIDDNGVGLTSVDENIQQRFHATEITEERLAILGKQSKKKTWLTIIDKKSRNEGNGVRVEMEVPFITES